MFFFLTTSTSLVRLSDNHSTELSHSTPVHFLHLFSLLTLRHDAEHEREERENEEEEATRHGDWLTERRTSRRTRPKGLFFLGDEEKFL